MMNDYDSILSDPESRESGSSFTASYLSVRSVSEVWEIGFVCALNGKYSSFNKKDSQRGASPVCVGVTSQSKASGKVVFREKCTEVSKGHSRRVKLYLNDSPCCEEQGMSG